MFMAVGVPAASALAPTWSVTQLTPNATEHGSPDISGDRMVWVTGGSESANEQCVTWKVGDATPTLLATDVDGGYGFGEVAVDGDRVAWVASDGDYDQIFTWKAGDVAPTKLTSDANDHEDLALSGDRVVWVSADADYYDQVFTWKAGDAGPTQLTVDENDHEGPAVSGDRVVWSASADDEDSTWQLWTCKVGDASSVQLGDESDSLAPGISGDRIAWVGYDGVDDEVFTWKAGDAVPTQLTTGAHFAADPVVSGDRVAWERDDGSHLQIYTWTAGSASTTKVTTDARDNFTGGISGDRIVWSAGQGGEDGNMEIMTWKAGDVAPQQLTIGSAGHDSPRVSGDRIVWEGLIKGGEQVFTAVPGPANVTTTALTIKTSATSCKVGKQFILSGLCDPTPDLVGEMMHVDVKKPGKTYWTYSSNRVIYAGTAGAASWQYKYTLKKGMTKGTYQFRAVYDGNTPYAAIITGLVRVVVK